MTLSCGQGGRMIIDRLNPTRTSPEPAAACAAPRMLNFMPAPRTSDAHGGPDMAILIALAPIGLFTAGISIGINGLMCVAVRREHSHLTLSKQPTDNVIRAGRLLNG